MLTMFRSLPPMSLLPKSTEHRPAWSTRSGHPSPSRYSLARAAGIFTDGHVVEVVWTKPSLSSVPTLTTPDGVPVALMPGQTWVELTPPGSTSFS